ncbi:unnamed protein product [Pipistrellus nathusii]|uniref:CWH43-like N-terminal domain-containing protein n=1 Tax=Pipistrellus nathusii TaxID=59473 RepID=A0ABN9ZKR2_PIPNA
MWGYLSLLPVFLAVWATTSIWTVFAIAVSNKTVNLTEGLPYISLCGSYPPQSCIFGQLLNMGAAMAAWICILRYHQFQGWQVRKWLNQLILWSGLLCAFGTSVVGNFQQKNQLPTHLAGAFLALFVGHVYFWLQVLLCWRMKRLPQPGAPWIWPLRLLLCTLCTVLLVTMLVLHFSRQRSAAAACEWAVAMLLFTLFGLMAVDFSGLEGCSLCLQPEPSLRPQPVSPQTPTPLPLAPARPPAGTDTEPGLLRASDASLGTNLPDEPPGADLKELGGRWPVCLSG